MLILPLDKKLEKIKYSFNAINVDVEFSLKNTLN